MIKVTFHKLTKSQLFKRAWKLAKHRARTFGGLSCTYFVDALSTCRCAINSVKVAISSNLYDYKKTMAILDDSLLVLESIGDKASKILALDLRLYQCDLTRLALILNKG